MQPFKDSLTFFNAFYKVIDAHLYTELDVTDFIIPSVHAAIKTYPFLDKH